MVIPLVFTYCYLENYFAIYEIDQLLIKGNSDALKLPKMLLVFSLI